VATLKKFNLSGEEVGQVVVDDRFINAEANSQMIKDYIVALRENARQWSANTKTRAEVKHTTKKPHPQKGQGRARHGNLVGPQFRGGGRVFAPKPKFDQHVRVNQKERKAAIRYLISEKLKENRVWVIDDTKMESPRTKTVVGFLNQLSIQGRVLFLGQSTFETIEFGEFSQKFNVGSDQHLHFARSVRNIPKTEFLLASNISGYDVMVARDLILTESALEELNQWLN
jgi:large subunit ribosomal protein L4